MQYENYEIKNQFQIFFIIIIIIKLFIKLFIIKFIIIIKLNFYKIKY